MNSFDFQTRMETEERLDRQAKIQAREPLLAHEIDPVDYMVDYEEEPDVDDSVRFCPECETPNQFGELCGRCQREIEMEENQ